MKFHLAVAGVVLVGASGTALAGFASNADVTDAFTGLAPAGSDYTLVGSIVGTNVAAADGNLVFDLESIGGAGIVQAVASFTSAQTNLQLSIHTGRVTGVYLSGVSFEQSGAGTPSALWVAANTADGALSSSSNNVFSFVLTNATTYSLTTQGGFTTGSTYTHVSLLFGFDNPSDRLRLDAVANGATTPPVVPLPSSASLGLALLSLLGGTKWLHRHRKASL